MIKIKDILESMGDITPLINSPIFNGPVAETDPKVLDHLHNIRMNVDETYRLKVRHDHTIDQYHEILKTAIFHNNDRLWKALSDKIQHELEMRLLREKHLKEDAKPRHRYSMPYFYLRSIYDGMSFEQEIVFRSK